MARLTGREPLKPKGRPGSKQFALDTRLPISRIPTFFIGQIINVRFFQRELAEKEVTHAARLKDDQLLAYWKLDNVENDVVRDLTGNDHNGKVSGRLGVASFDEKRAEITAGVSRMPDGGKWLMGNQGDLLLSLPAGPDPLAFVVSVSASKQSASAEALATVVAQPPLDLKTLSKRRTTPLAEELKKRDFDRSGSRTVFRR